MQVHYNKIYGCYENDIFKNTPLKYFKQGARSRCAAAGSAFAKKQQKGYHKAATLPQSIKKGYRKVSKKATARQQKGYRKNVNISFPSNLTCQYSSKESKAVHFKTMIIVASFVFKFDEYNYGC